MTSFSDRATDETGTIPSERVDRVRDYFKRLFERSLEFEFATQLRADLDKPDGARGESGEVPVAPGDAGADAAPADDELPSRDNR